MKEYGVCYVLSYVLQEAVDFLVLLTPHATEQEAHNREQVEFSLINDYRVVFHMC